MKRLSLVAAAAATLALAGPAAAAKTCTEPDEEVTTWQRAAPAEVGMDAAKLQDAVDYGTTQASYAVRVYRHGCLVAADRLESASQNAWYESWSMAKSVTALVFGRAMTMGLISADDPVGSLIPEADAAHGAITLRHLLTMTSGLRWNGFRDYNIAMEDRLRDFLTVDIAHKPGTWYEYSQTGPFTLAEAVSRAAGEDIQAFAQRELFGPLGIRGGTWKWERDKRGRTQGFFGVSMRPDDFARLGDLMRRNGVWKGRRLLSKEFIAKALTPTKTNGCYGWLIWLNKGKPCIGPTVSERPVRDRRSMPTLPTDVYTFSGLFGQLVAVFPTQDVVVVRTGSDPGLVNFAGGAGWEETLYTKVLSSITDGPIGVTDDGVVVAGDAGQENPDKGFQYSWSEQDQIGAPYSDDPIPAAGPYRQRAVILRAGVPALTPGRRVVRIRAACPRVAEQPCEGTATVARARRAQTYSIAPGTARVLRFTLRRKLPATARVVARALTKDAGGGTPSSVGLAFR